MRGARTRPGMIVSMPFVGACVVRVPYRSTNERPRAMHMSEPIWQIRRQHRICALVRRRAGEVPRGREWRTTARRWRGCRQRDSFAARRLGCDRESPSPSSSARRIWMRGNCCGVERAVSCWLLAARMLNIFGASTHRAAEASRSRFYRSCRSRYQYTMNERGIGLDESFQ